MSAMPDGEMSAEHDGLQDVGPIDYLIVEWPEKQPTGEAVPHLIDLVDRGLIRIIDLAFIRKEEDGSVSRMAIGEVDREAMEFAVSGLADRSAQGAWRAASAGHPH